ncbi:MAG: hypothetical protein D8M59_00840 [Planctomycetes bacterium]|nr:hypothetical protein [Planctomycetota bacterium]
MLRFRCRQCGEQLDAPEEMAGDIMECPKCGAARRAPVPEQEPEPKRKPVSKPAYKPISQPHNLTGKGAPICQVCQGEMKKTNYRPGGNSNLVFAIALVLLGVLLTMTLVGAVLGIPLIVMAVFLDKVLKVWKCTQCGAVIERAD